LTLRNLAKRLRPKPTPPDPLRAGLFDREWYEIQRSRTFPDDGAALDDYLRNGRVDGLSPHPLFEPAWYRPKDWRTAAEDPLITYLRVGRGPGPHPLFDGARYATHHPEATRHPGGALGHFLRSATPETPVFSTLGDPPRRWETLRSELLAAQHLWASQQREVGPPMAMPPGEQTVVALVARAGTVPLPDTGTPLVSVVLPVRNRATHLVAAIASVQSQTFGGWELVVVDGGSTDATLHVLEILASVDARIRLIPTPAQGSSAARNAGIEAARGRYVAFLDADNIWSPEHLRVALATLVATPCAAVHSMSRRSFRGITYSAFPPDPRALCLRNYVDVNALVVERQVLRTAGDFDLTLPRFAEQDLGIKLSQASEIVPVDYVATTCYQDPSLTDRASLTEPAAWTEVVTSRHEWDWTEIVRDVELRDREVSVLVPDVLGWKATVGTVGSALGPDIEVMVAHGGGSRFDWTMLVAHLGGKDGVRLIRTPVPRSPAFLTNLAFAAARGRAVTVLPAGATVASGSVRQLVHTLGTTDRPVVQPTVRDVQHHTPTLAGLTVSAHSLAAAGGFDVLSRPGQEAADLLRRIAGNRQDAMVLDAEVEVELTNRARATYAPSTEVGLSG
jgi:hypothetical protein